MMNWIRHLKIALAAISVAGLLALGGCESGRTTRPGTSYHQDHGTCPSAYSGQAGHGACGAAGACPGMGANTHTGMYMTH